jgi:N-methylhydantoinase A
VHAARLAEELDIPRVLIPPIPGGFSALGLVATDVRRDYARTFYAALPSADPAEIAAACAAMEGEAHAMLSRAGVPKERWEVTRLADCRYPRQAYELTVPLASGLIARRSGASRGRSTASSRHLRPRKPGKAVQLVSLRVSALGRQAPLDLARARKKPAGPLAARSACLKLASSCDVIARDGLAPGATVPGPVIVGPPTPRSSCPWLEARGRAVA